MKISYNIPVAFPAAVACAMLTGVLALPSPAVAAIVQGSTAQFIGTAEIAPSGNITFIPVGTAPVGSDAGIRIAVAGNLGSYAGYNDPNPAALPIAPNYIAGFNNITGGMVPVGTFLVLPTVSLAGGEPGPAVGMTRFVASSWTTQFGSVDGVEFFIGVAQGTIFDDSDGTSIGGTFSLSSQNLDLSPGGAIEAFSGTLVATVIPVPAAAWMLGSGLLAMFAAGRRRKS